MGRRPKIQKSAEERFALFMQGLESDQVSDARLGSVRRARRVNYRKITPSDWEARRARRTGVRCAELRSETVRRTEPRAGCRVQRVTERYKPRRPTGLIGAAAQTAHCPGGQ